MAAPSLHARAREASLMLAIAASLPACGGSSHPPGPSGGDDPEIWVSDGRFSVQVFASDIGHPRQMAFAPNGDLFVNNGKVTVLFDDDGSGTSSDAERSTFATAPGLNHGIALSRDGAFVYASSETTVYRWPYTAGARTASGAPEVVVSGIPSGGHTTRTLVFDSQGRLYVSVGSASNIDVEPVLVQTRAQIRRFVVPGQIPPAGLAYTTGEVVASGMRNEVGLFMDAHDRMWGVENGRDQLTNNGDVHNDNPGEEINLIDGTGSSYYGYPSCFSEFNLPGGNGPGTQWADTTLAATDRKTDGWCRDLARVHPPAFALPAHWAPLGILEYQGNALPLGHDLIVTAHGSWNSDTPVGRLLARVHRNGDAIAGFEPLLGERGPDGGLRQGQWSVRPVDIREASDGTLYFSDDNGGRIFKVSYTSN